MSLILENPLKILSALVCILVVVGLFKRTKRRTHITMMASALTIDLGIVLYLEITRHVVESVPSRDPSGLLLFHIALSVVVLVLYGVQVYTGITRKLKNLPCPLHKKAAVLFVITRFGNLITSIIVMQQ
jgi:uncharacterized membrane protein YozB (DUF420 family)